MTTAGTDMSEQMKQETQEIEMRHDFALVLSTKVRMDQAWAISADLKEAGFVADIEPI
jgi:hypothetical protein